MRTGFNLRRDRQLHFSIRKGRGEITVAPRTRRCLGFGGRLSRRREQSIPVPLSPVPLQTLSAHCTALSRLTCASSARQYSEILCATRSFYQPTFFVWGVTQDSFGGYPGQSCQDSFAVTVSGTEHFAVTGSIKFCRFTLSCRQRTISLASQHLAPPFSLYL